MKYIITQDGKEIPFTRVRFRINSLLSTKAYGDMPKGWSLGFLKNKLKNSKPSWKLSYNQIRKIMEFLSNDLSNIKKIRVGTRLYYYAE